MTTDVMLSDLSPSALQLRSLVRVLREDNARLTDDNRDLRLRLMLYEDAGTLKKRFLTIAIIQQCVADHFGLAVECMTSSERPNYIAHPRQIAMTLSRAFTRCSLHQIGLAFGGRDHATVIHACRNIDNLMAQDETICAAVCLLRSRLREVAGLPPVGEVADHRQ